MADSLLRAVLDASPLPMWICDALTLRVLAVNDRALDYFGHRREQFLAMPSTALEATPEVAAGREIERGGERGDVLRYHKADGTIVKEHGGCLSQ